MHTLSMDSAITTILYFWPYVALVLSLVALYRLKAYDTKNWTKPSFLLSLLWPLYCLHQFEEYGMDALGRRYAFLSYMCSHLGHSDLNECPVGAYFVFLINVFVAPISFIMPVLWSKSRPSLAAFGWNLVLSNVFVGHIFSSISSNGTYNPGLLTSVLLFVPLSLWVMHVLVQTKTITIFQAVMIHVTGAFFHTIFFLSLVVRNQGLISDPVLLLINVLNGFTPMISGFIFESKPDAKVSKA